ncbi:CDGSH iron-sulfur domain-containing protein [Hoeflea sp. TYP-13]|uniref:CDGSH iron-sulfur domain-containing protein n=1 Tax=Hoeflea sp. TYP-13 TaxID=3230023 RepID=UPI0034C61435
MSDDKVIIEQRENGPLVVKNLSDLRLADGTAAEAKPVMALCRCGGSQNKPFCDGTHKNIGFESAGSDVAAKDKVRAYEGKDVTVYYNMLLCSHAGECGRRAAAVFNPKQKPWIQPDNGTREDIHEVMQACPSGALRYSETGGRAELVANGDVCITVEKDGPYRVSNVPVEAGYWAQGQSEKKYVLCRCGKSGNKPFCDGTHRDEGWSDETGA